MKPVLQTRFGGPDVPIERQGNCFAACVASLLELPLPEVDDYLAGVATTSELDRIWWPAFVSWCGKRGLVPLYLPWGSKATPEQYAYGHPRLRYIACGDSPRGLRHSVVYLDGQLEHDPHPDGGGLASVDTYIVLVKKL